MYAAPDLDALLFTGVQGGPLRRGNFNKLSGWPHAARAIGAEGLHFTTCATPGTTWQQPACWGAAA